MFLIISLLITIYAEEGDLVENDIISDRVISAPLLGGIKNQQEGDTLLKRNLIRHNSKQLTSELVKIVNHL